MFIDCILPTLSYSVLGPGGTARERGRAVAARGCRSCGAGAGTLWGAAADLERQRRQHTMCGVAAAKREDFVGFSSEVSAGGLVSKSAQRQASHESAGE